MHEDKFPNFRVFDESGVTATLRFPLLGDWGYETHLRGDNSLTSDTEVLRSAWYYNDNKNNDVILHLT